MDCSFRRRIRWPCRANGTKRTNRFNRAFWGNGAKRSGCDAMDSLRQWMHNDNQSQPVFREYFHSWAGCFSFRSVLPADNATDADNMHLHTGCAGEFGFHLLRIAWTDSDSECGQLRSLGKYGSNRGYRTGWGWGHNNKIG